MSIRDDLAQTIFEAMYWVDSTDDIEQAGADAEHLADAALDWLDPWLNEFRDEYVAGRAPAQHVWSIDAAIEQVRQATMEPDK